MLQKNAEAIGDPWLGSKSSRASRMPPEDVLEEMTGTHTYVDENAGLLAGVWQKDTPSRRLALLYLAKPPLRRTTLKRINTGHNTLVCTSLAASGLHGNNAGRAADCSV